MRNIRRRTQMMRKRFSLRVLLAALCCALAWPGALAAGAEAAAAVHNPYGVAVIIGNRDYVHTENVKYAHRDTDAFRHYVTNLLGFDPARIIHLRDVTLAQMIEVFGNERDFRGDVWRLLDQGGRSDVVVFYSGHGVPGLRDKRGYLAPVNAKPDTVELSGYPIDVLYANLGKLEKARSVVVYLDACFSGDSYAGMLFRKASPVKIQAALPENVDRRVTVLTAASGKEIASWDDRARHGLFTNHLLSALYGAGDGNRDGRVTAGEAKAYLDRYMTEAARSIRRVQNASLVGTEDAVLSVARFPERPPLAGEAKAVKKDKKKAAKIAKLPQPAPGKEATLDRKKRILVQRGLASLKFDPGPIDGAFGPKTREAISSWQKAKGYDATGRLGKEQADALAALGGEALREKSERERREREALEKAEAERLAREAAVRERAAREAREREEAARRAREEEERKRALLRPGRVFRDCPDCPEMVVVPAGSFMMGSNAYSSEKPIHRVRIAKPFAVGKYEVTFAEWDACASDGGCGGRRPADNGWGRDRRPVINVSWRDAKAYVRWLSRKTGKRYRLLSESEWEYATRAGTTTRYSWGDEVGHNRANCDGCGSRWDDKQTAPVGSFPANGFGLHDMHGNVWEWMEDCWNKSYAGAPADGSARTGGDCGERVLRGGSWIGTPGNLRSAFRFWSSTGIRFNFIGFRVARTLTP